MKHPFQTRRPIAVSGQMLILYGVKSVGSLDEDVDRRRPKSAFRGFIRCFSLSTSSFTSASFRFDRLARCSPTCAHIARVWDDTYSRIYRDRYFAKEGCVSGVEVEKKSGGEMETGRRIEGRRRIIDGGTQRVVR